MAKEVSQVVVPASSTGVVVQTIATAALKTFGQAFLAGLALTFSPWLLELAQDVAGGGTIDVSDLNVGSKLIVSAALGAGSAVISFLMNYFAVKTLTPGHAVEAEVKP